MKYLDNLTILFLGFGWGLSTNSMGVRILIAIIMVASLLRIMEGMNEN